MASLLSLGWTAEAIERGMKEYSRMYPDREMDLITFFAGREKRSNNLLRCNTYYFHNILRNIPKPPVSEVDYEAGTITKTSEPYYLEMRASFSLDDLYDYYLSHESLYDKTGLNPKKIRGGLEWLVRQYGLELVLYMINIAADALISNDQPPLDSVMDIQDYLRFAKEALQSRITDVKMTGDDKIVPKKRIRLD